ncbi:HEAT repeat domain-containing protein [Planctomycetota bacterium]
MKNEEVEEVLDKLKPPALSELTVQQTMTRARAMVQQECAITETGSSDFAGAISTSKFTPAVRLSLAAAACVVIAIAIFYARHQNREDKPRQRQVATPVKNTRLSTLPPVLRHVYQGLRDGSNLAVLEEGETCNLFLLSETEKLTVWQVRKLTAVGMEIEHMETGEIVNIPLEPSAEGVAGYSQDIPPIYTRWKKKKLQASDWEMLAELVNGGDGAAVALLNSMIANVSGNGTIAMAKVLLHGDKDINVLGRLIAVAADRKHSERGRIIRRLARIESPLSCLALRKIAADVADPERIKAIRGLGALKDQNALDLLERISQNDAEDQKVRKESQKALVKIQNKD